MGTSANRHPRRLAPAFRQPTVRTFTVTTENQRVAEADYNRVVLVFAGNVGGAAFVSTDPNAATGTGIPVLPTANPVSLTYAQYGRLVQEAWYLVNDVPGGNVTVFEVSLQDEDYIGRL